MSDNQSFGSAAEYLVSQYGQGSFRKGRLHASTRGAAYALQQIDLRNKTVLDGGTGAGELAIIAAKLGVSRVVAADSNSDAVYLARENAKLNKVHDKITFVTGRVENIQPGRTGPVHVAVLNILPDFLPDILPGLLDHYPMLEEIILAAGTHKPKYLPEQVLDALSLHSFTFTTSLPVHELWADYIWTTYIAKRTKGLASSAVVAKPVREKYAALYVNHKSTDIIELNGRVYLQIKHPALCPPVRFTHTAKRLQMLFKDSQKGWDIVSRFLTFHRINDYTRDGMCFEWEVIEALLDIKNIYQVASDGATIDTKIVTEKAKEGNWEWVYIYFGDSKKRLSTFVAESSSPAWSAKRGTPPVSTRSDVGEQGVDHSSSLVSHEKPGVALSDRVIASVILIIGLPVVVISALIIKLSREQNNGKVFFRQKRIVEIGRASCRERV